MLPNLKELLWYCDEHYSDRMAFMYQEKGSQIRVSYHEFRKQVQALGTFRLEKNYRNVHIEQSLLLLLDRSEEPS